ncbi:MAG: hypothetical protein IKH49_01665 [Bacteroidales bacterium]|nr:hypothetical protein [Bacteroidales bacterium]
MENNFSVENSLRLITETIERSRSTIVKNAGKPLIVWGFLVSLTSVIIYFLWKYAGGPVWNFLWFAMTAVGMLCMYYMERNREKAPQSEIGRILGKIWMWFGIFATGVFALVWVAFFIKTAITPGATVRLDLTLVISLMMGLCGAISGSVINRKVISICSVVATACSTLWLLISAEGSPERILCFALLGFLALVIPGIILQKEGGR